MEGFVNAVLVAANLASYMLMNLNKREWGK